MCIRDSPALADVEPTCGSGQLIRTEAQHRRIERPDAAGSALRQEELSASGAAVLWTELGGGPSCCQGGCRASSSQVAAELTGAPFRGSAAVRAGMVSWSRLRSGCWRRLLPDVYAAASLPETVTLRARAAALVLPSGAAVTGSSAAWLHGVDVRAGDEPLEVTLPRGAAHAPHPSLRIRRALLTAADVTLAQAVPVTTPLRTAFDFARQPDEVAGMVGLDALLHAELVTAGQVLDFAAAHPGLSLIHISEPTRLLSISY